VANYLDKMGMSALGIIDFTIYYNSQLYTITASPYLFPARNGMPLCFETTINGKSVGDVNYVDEKWESDSIEDKELLNQLGSGILSKFGMNQNLSESAALK
jgi:hypothetical protein